MNKHEQQEVELALDIADRMANVAKASGATARIEFVAHLCAAIGLGMANQISLDKMIVEFRSMYKEAVRTEHDTGKAAKRKGLGVIEGDKK